jgi:DNA polymerase-3 subunit epsilon
MVQTGRKSSTICARARRAQPDVPPNLDFRHVADTLGVPALARHSAVGDATTVALCWLALQGAARNAPAARP